MVPTSSLGYPGPAPAAEPINPSTSPRASHQPNRLLISSLQSPQETPRLHPVGSAALLPRPSSPSSTISENESPGSEASSQGDLSPDDSVPPIAADKQSDSGRRHACPHCAKRFNRPSSLAIHVNTHTGDKRVLYLLYPHFNPCLPSSRFLSQHSNARSRIAGESST